MQVKVKDDGLTLIEIGEAGGVSGLLLLNSLSLLTDRRLCSSELTVLK